MADQWRFVVPIILIGHRDCAFFKVQRHRSLGRVAMTALFADRRAINGPGYHFDAALLFARAAHISEPKRLIRLRSDIGKYLVN